MAILFFMLIGTWPKLGGGTATNLNAKELDATPSELNKLPGKE
jgi:hypothetical protein